jgi:hypothetical protein
MLPSGISIRIREDLIDGAARTQTTLVVDPIVTLSGHRVTMDDIGDIGYAKIDGGTAREEIVSWTGITDNTTTYTLTGCTWGVNFHNLSAAVANRRRHTSGAKFEIKTDMHYITYQFRENDDNVFTNTDAMEFQGNEIKLGDGTSVTDKVITADNGDTNEPFVKYDETLGKWVVSNDGVNSYDPEDGGSGVTAGDGISITGGAVAVDMDLLTDDNGLVVTGNRLGTVLNEDTGLYKDASGIGIDVIDPDAPVAQSAATLVGGTTVDIPGLKAVAQANSGAGAFNITIEDQLYESVSMSLVDSTNSAKITQSTADQQEPFGNGYLAAQTLDGTDLYSISSITINTGLPAGSTTVKMELGYGDDPNTGTILGDVSLSITTSGAKTFTFASPIITGGVTNLFWRISVVSGNAIYPYRSNADTYAGGAAWYASAGSMTVRTYDWYTVITGKSVLASGGNISTSLQAAIRAATSGTETVAWSTDHFVITSSYSGQTSHVSKLTAPTAGADVSELLDLGTNATEVAGDGDDYKVVRLNASGLLPYGVSNLTQEVLTVGSGTWTKPTGVKKIRVRAVGGGASGTAGVSNGAGTGGGAGGYVEEIIDVSAVASVAYTVGAASNNTTFGDYFTAGGASGSTGGSATGGDINIVGQKGGSGGAVGYAGIPSGAGGSSMLGLGGASVGYSDGTGNSGTGYGSGGAGGGTSSNGGAGTAGVIIIEY